MLGDARLLQHYARNGDQPAFTTLVEKYQSMVIGTAYRQTRNAELAREVAQEVFAALARKARSLIKRDSLAGWLHRAALYESVHVMKAETRRHARNERYSSQMAIFATSRGPEHRSAEGLAVIDEALGELAENDREALVLHYFQDLSYPEMAKTLALSEPAVRQRVSRALHHLELVLRSRGYSGNAVVLLLAAVATHPGLAIPAGLSASALALAKSGASSSLPWFLSGLVPNSTKTAALVLAVAGTALLWETDPPASRTAAAAIVPTMQTPGLELPNEPQPARLASTAPQGQATQQTNSEPAFSSPAHQNAIRHAARAQVTKPVETAAARLGGEKPRPASARPTAPGNLPSEGVARELPEAAEALEARVPDFPRLAWELREAELLPRRAAELYTDLLTQLLELNHAQQLRVEEFLAGHYAQLRDRGIAGRRPPDFPQAEWIEARNIARDEAVTGIGDALESDPPIIKDILDAVDAVEVPFGVDAGDGPLLGL